MFSIRDVAKQNNLLLAYHRLLTNPESTYKNFLEMHTQQTEWLLREILLCCEVK